MVGALAARWVLTAVAAAGLMAALPRRGAGWSPGPAEGVSAVFAARCARL